MSLRSDLEPGNRFPDFVLPDTDGSNVVLSQYAGGWPTILTFHRGNYCPKDRRQLTNYAAQLQPELLVNYCKLLSVSVETRLGSFELKTGAGAHWPFLSDDKRELMRQLGFIDDSDPRFSPVYIPYTFVLEGDLTIYKAYYGWWYVGRPTVEELRMDLRAVVSKRPDWEYSKDWQAGRHE